MLVTTQAIDFFLRQTSTLATSFLVSDPQQPSDGGADVVVLLLGAPSRALLAAEVERHAVQVLRHVRRFTPVLAVVVAARGPGDAPVVVDSLRLFRRWRVAVALQDADETVNPGPMLRTCLRQNKCTWKMGGCIANP